MRLPGKFAKQLFGYTDIGDHVIVNDEELTFGPVVSGKLLYPNGTVPVQEASSSSAPDAGASPSVLQIRSRPVSDKATTEDAANDRAVGNDFVLRQGLDTMKSEEAGRANVPQEAVEPVRILITR